MTRQATSSADKAPQLRNCNDRHVDQFNAQQLRLQLQLSVRGSDIAVHASASASSPAGREFEFCSLIMQWQSFAAVSIAIARRSSFIQTVAKCSIFHNWNESTESTQTLWIANFTQDVRGSKRVHTNAHDGRSGRDELDRETTRRISTAAVIAAAAIAAAAAAA